MNKKSFNLNKSLLFNKFITYLYIIYIFTPILYKYFYFGLILFTLWFMSCSLNKKAVNSIIHNKYNYVVYFWIIYSFVMRIIGFSKAAWGNYFIMIMFFFPIIMYNVQNKIFTLKEKTKLIKFSIIVISINLLDNIRLILKYPDITKEMNFVSTFNNLNIGDTIYSLVLNMFTLIILWILLNKKRNIALLILVVIGMIYPILAGKTTAMLILYACSILLIFRKACNKLDKKIVISVSTIGLIILSLVTPNILKFISENINNANIANRIVALYKLDLNSIYFERINLAKLSAETFIRHPLIGIGYQKVALNGDLMNAYNSGIGHHSELIDHLARYGFVGLIFYCIILKQYLNRMKKICKTKSEKDLIFTVVISFILFSILNNSFTAPVGMIIFMILPYVVQVYSEEKEVIK